MQKVGVDSEPHHSTDFGTIFEIMSGLFVMREFEQTYITESRGSFGALQRPDCKSLGLDPHFSDPSYKSDSWFFAEIQTFNWIVLNILQGYAFTRAFVMPLQILQFSLSNPSPIIDNPCP